MTAAMPPANRSLADVILDFITELRQAGVPISIAESLDAMRAIALVGLARTRLRAALLASLIKDEAHRATFERTFSTFFAAPPRFKGEPRSSTGGLQGVHGARGQNDSDSPASSPPTTRPEALPSPQSKTTYIVPVQREESSHGATQKAVVPPTSVKAQPEHAGTSLDRAADKAALHTNEPARTEVSGASSSAIEHVPFVNYSALEYQQARDVLVPLLRQLRLRLGRGMRSARAGRIDLRRTLHAAVQHGGAPIDLRFRARRPKHIELVVLADISGSVQYASTLLLELVAGAREHFRRVRSFVFIDELAEADFEHGHLVMTPNLDLFARSDLAACSLN